MSAADDDPIPDAFMYGLRFRYTKYQPAKLMCDSKREVLKQLTRHLESLTRPHDWEFFSQSLKEWWKLEQKIKVLEAREYDCVRGIQLGPHRLHRVHERLDGLTAWFDERHMEDAARRGVLDEVQIEKSGLYEEAYEQQQEIEREVGQMKEQLVIVRNLRVEEQRKQNVWRYKVSPGEIDMFKEREGVRRNNKIRLH